MQATTTAAILYFVVLIVIGWLCLTFLFRSVVAAAVMIEFGRDKVTWRVLFALLCLLNCQGT